MDPENLYDSLSYNIPIEDLSIAEKQDLTESVKNFNAEQKELVYRLILHDYVKTRPSTKVIFPYKTKQITPNSLEIKVDALPIRLKRILYKFSKIVELSENETTPTPHLN